MTVKALANSPVRALRWRVSDAVERSRLPMPAKTIMGVLLNRADVHTGEVPYWRCPSYSELADLISAHRSTVIRYVKHLTELGWLVRTIPSRIESLMRRERNRYRITLPSDVDDDAPAVSPKTAGRSQVAQCDSSLDLKNKDQNLDARERARVPADTMIDKVRRKIFPEKKPKHTPDLPILASKNLSPTDQRTITEHVQRLAKAPINNMGAYLTAMDRNGQLDPIIAATRAPARERQQRAATTPQYLIDLETRRNATTTASATARATIRAIIGKGVEKISTMTDYQRAT